MPEMICSRRRKLDEEELSLFSNDDICKLLSAHRTFPTFLPDGTLGKQPRYRIWMRAVRREARKRGLL